MGKFDVMSFYGREDKELQKEYERMFCNMTEEEKQILLKDLSARIPYQPLCKKIDTEDDFCECDGPLGYSLRDFVGNKVIIKPYLRPMSSMTEEEVKEIRKINWQFWKPKNDSDECFVGDADDGYCSVSQMARIINYLNAHHFDYLGLIPMGLALEAPEGMYKTE